MTNIKSVVGKVSLTALSLVLFFLLTAYAESLYSWYQWWSDGAAPIELEVKVKRIQALTGRDRGSQFFYVENSEGGYRLDSKFSSKESKSLDSLDEKLLVKYYLTATGSKYVFYIHGLDTNQVYYSKLLVDKGWQGFAVFFVCAFLFSILVAVVFCLFNFDMFV